MPNDLIALGTSALVLIKFPDAPPADPALKSALFAVDSHANYKDGLIIAQVDPTDIPTLRKAGAEVFVIDANSNDYIVNTTDLSDSERVAYIDERLARAKDDLLVASVKSGGGGAA